MYQPSIVLYKVKYYDNKAKWKQCKIKLNIKMLDYASLHAKNKKKKAFKKKQKKEQNSE